jgi:hypothetical protein
VDRVEVVAQAVQQELLLVVQELRVKVLQAVRVALITPLIEMQAVAAVLEVLAAVQVQAALLAQSVALVCLMQ